MEKEERQVYLDKLAQKPSLKRPPMIRIASIHVADNRANMNIDRSFVEQKTGKYYRQVYDTRILAPKQKDSEYAPPIIVPPNMDQLPELEAEEEEKQEKPESLFEEVPTQVDEEKEEGKTPEEEEEERETPENEEEDKSTPEEDEEERVPSESKEEEPQLPKTIIPVPKEKNARVPKLASLVKAVPVNPQTYKTMEINGRKIADRLPKPEKIKIKTSDYYMTNRKLYTQKLAELFREYNEEIINENETVTCDNRTTGSGKETQLFIHQRVVRDYLNLYTPYRGLLLLHGLGSGKTATSIAIAEGMKSEKRVFVLTPASLKMNFFSELKKYGDPLYKKNQYWEFVSINGMPQYVDMLSSVLSLSPEFVKRNGGAWMVDVSKQTSNFKDLDSAQQKQLDDQLNQMIRSKYVDINYNGLNKNKMRDLVSKYGDNPFHDAVILVDEAHNLVSRISNKLKNSAAPTTADMEQMVEQIAGDEISLQLYRWIMEANNARVVFMSGTPMINYPNEIGIMFNMLRGYIKTWTIHVTPPAGFAKEQLYNMLNSANFRTYDYIDYSNGKITVTRNPFGFMNQFSSANNMLGGNMLGGEGEGEGEETGINIAVIIPYRNSGSLNRSEHLAKISIELPKLFDKYISEHSEQKLIYKIIIVEQSEDGQKFNRGKLLNVGYKIAVEGGANVFIFHDVDLIPSEDLIEYYFQVPEDGKPIHIAKVWGRYSKNPEYLGGITSFNKSMFENMNGFPNNFWGWGGEDDELYKRANEFGYKPIAPTHGEITDLEGINLEQKLDYLRANADELKNMKKWELLKEHEQTWKTNGLSDLQYQVKKTTENKETHLQKITVDIGEENAADNYNRTKTVRKKNINILDSYKDALTVGSAFIKNGKRTQVKAETPDFYVTPPQTDEPIWEMSIDALTNTLNYLMNYLNHTCYMLCVKANAGKLYKLTTHKTSDIYKSAITKSLLQLDRNDKLTEENRETVTKLLKSKALRFMQCVVKKYSSEEGFSEEYTAFVDGVNLPDGVYILNLTDSVILRKDWKHPFPMVVGDVDIGEFKNKKFIPILSTSGQKGYYDIPIPNYDDVIYALGEAPVKIDSFETDWNKKINKAVFRGGPTGCGYTTETNQRLKLTTISSDLIDVGLTGKGDTIDSNSVKYDPKYGVGVMNTGIKPGTFMSMADQSKHKYIIHIDGNVHAYRLLTSMATGSLLLRVESEYTSWLDHILKPNEHYIPIKSDLSDLVSTIESCNQDQERCRTIAENAMKIAKQALDLTVLRQVFQTIAIKTNRKYSSGQVLVENGAAKKNKREEEKPYDPNAKYVGVRLSEQGNISDKRFMDTFVSILENNNFVVNKKIDTMYHKCLPDTKDEFNKWFVDIETITLKNVNVLKKRILGLTSYFRSAQESLLPSFVKNKEGGIYHIEQCDMSQYQLGEYEKVRKEEADAEKKRAEKQRKKKPGTEDAEIASAYRIFSRLMCNFVFPTSIDHPKPPSARKLNDLAPEQIIEQVENRKDETADHEDIADDATLPDLSAEYQKEIQEALAKLNTTMVNLSGATRDVHVLSPESLEIHSPKFLRILNNLQDEKNEGNHLIYSNFRTMEGIGILKMVLEHNGYAEFKLAKTGSGDWSIVDTDANEPSSENKKKPKFVLYTGTETAEEKEVIRNVYNSNWDLLPAALAAQLREIHPNNYRGEIIRVLMITAAGAEGINLENTRFVHIVEPYWNLVRIEQVVGRARRICSHKNLPPEMRTVQVFLYMSAFSQEQIKSKNHIDMMTRDVGRLDGKPITTDQYLYQLASLKDNLTSQILGAIKSTAMDCALYAKNNKENIVCYGYGNVKSNDFGTFPTLEKDAQEKEDMNVERRVEKPKKIKIPGQGEFAFIPGDTTMYDLNAFMNSNQLVPVGHITGEGNDRKVVFNT